MTPNRINATTVTTGVLALAMVIAAMDLLRSSQACRMAVKLVKTMNSGHAYRIGPFASTPMTCEETVGRNVISRAITAETVRVKADVAKTSVCARLV